MMAVARFLPLLFFMVLLLVSLACACIARELPVRERAMGAPAMDNPDAYLPTPNILAKYGYPAESHVVRTDDGYLLTMHRVPYSPKSPRRRTAGGKKPVVFLQHGLLGSSADWIFAGVGKGLAYLLADAGYDVWLGNVRGNTYSRSHVSLDSSQPQFWDFSFHEMGYHDLPAEIDYVLETTEQRDLVYVGHSMGTTMFYVMMATRPEFGPKIRAMFSLAPVMYMGRVKSPIRLLAPFADDLEFIVHFLGATEFLPQNKIIRFLSRYGCELFTTEEKICENSIFAITGFDDSQFNMTLLPIVLGHTPAGASTKTLIHYAQEIRSGKFQKYDYGLDGNMKRYGKATPPEYNVSAIQPPVSLHYSDNDWLANVDDVDQLYHQLPNALGKHRVPLPQFNHLDFLWAKDVKTLLYDSLLDLIHKEVHPSKSSGSRSRH
ncbi:lipase 3-like [Ischnura elegans]|uniref:lipase 3-like n=1 Tax=Ischnura elegans TaxID=197161 RepID=UPI001ED89492|nr:lipase 3-like [Ischnura elegans]